MRNLLLSTVTLLVVPAVSKTAGICFLGVGDCAPSAGFDSAPNSGGGDDEDFDINTGNQCLNEGFTKQSCNSVQVIDGVCPYNSAYGRGCKCASNLIECPAGQVGEGESCDGKYASCKCDPTLIACSSKEVGQGVSCGGKYESCVCKSEYQYDANNCSYPQSTTGDECQGKYTECVCPTGVDEGEFGCEEYYPSPCDSICKIAYSDNCHNRTDDTSVYGCMKWWADCDTKCETPYPDNCHNTTAVISSCPANATCQYFDDCSKEVSSWSCNSGYTQTGNRCVNPCEGYYECGGTWQYCMGSTCPADSSMCSEYCDYDMFPYQCDNEALCNGEYRGGFCSVDTCNVCEYDVDVSLWDNSWEDFDSGDWYIETGYEITCYCGNEYHSIDSCSSPAFDYCGHSGEPSSSNYEACRELCCGS